MMAVVVALLALPFPVRHATPPPGIFPSAETQTSSDAARAISHHIRIGGAFAADLIVAIGRTHLMDCLSRRPEATIEIGETSSATIIDRDPKGCSLAATGDPPLGARPFIRTSRREVAALVLAFNRWNVSPSFRQNDRDLAKYDVELEYRSSMVAVIFDPIRALVGANASVAGCPHAGLANAIFLFDRATLKPRPAHYAC